MKIDKEQIIENKKYLSETIGVLRFPLMVAVVLSHIFVPNIEKHLLVNIYDKYINSSFVYITVHLFFFISGFLFFYGNNKFGFVEYLNNLKKRVKRLLVPYFLWGIIFVGIRYLCYLLGQSDNIDLFVDKFRWLYYVVLFPINYQLWFIRDLFLIVLISPLIYFFLKRLNFLFVILLGIVWLFYHNNFFILFGVEDFIRTKTDLKVVGYDFMSLFFFSFGAWFALYNKDFTLLFKYLFPLTLVSYLFCATYRFILCDIYWGELFHRFAILSGMMSIITIVYMFVKKGKVKRNMFLERGSQSIYYYHVIFLTYFVGILKLLHVFEIDNSCVYTLVYISIPIITILLGLWLYKIGMRYMPRVMNVILGLK